MIKRAFTLVEILGVIAIIGILFAISFTSYNSITMSNKVSAVESDLRSLNSGFNSFTVDHGVIAVDPSASDYIAKIGVFTDVLNRDYLNTELRLETDYDSEHKVAKLITRTQKDSWGNPYCVYINTDSKNEESDNVPGLIVIASNGADGISNKNTYKSGNYGDDILAVIEPHK